ncbi:MAG: hypothetical protein ABL899_01705 [Nitrospira sp.]
MAFNVSTSLMRKTSILLVIFSLSTIFTPQKAFAQYIDVAAVAKEVGDTITYTLMQTVLNKLTAQTVNYINSGFQGNPSFITDPDQFFLDVGDDVASSYLSNPNSDLNKLCSPFRAQVRVSVVKSYLSGRGNYSCTLGTLENNYDAFMSDFSQGGWEGWFSITQNNSNNPYGAYIDQKNALDYQIGNARSNKQNQLNWANGFLSVEKCDGVVVTEPGQTKGECHGKMKTVTPGIVINDQLSKSLGSSWERLQAADEINEIVGALVSQMTSKVLGGVSDGLRGLSKKSSSGNSPADDLGNLNPPTPQMPPQPSVPNTDGLIKCDSDGTNCKINN